MEDYKEFRAKTLKLNTKKSFKVTNSYGTKEAWRWIKKNKWLNIGTPITEREFGQIIKAYHKVFIDRLLNGLEVTFPLRMGILEVRKYNTSISFKNGKLKTNLPINWGETLKYWNEDKEAFTNKALIRQENKNVFRVYYKKNKALYNNKSYYNFTVARSLKHLLRDKIKDNRMEAFEL